MSREKEIVKTSIIAIIANTFLVVTKIITGLISNSIAIIMDGINNLSDALSSILTIIGTYLANKEPDKEHPYGYGRIEYITSLIISVIVLAAGGSSLRDSAEKIFHPEVVNYTAVTFIIIIVGIFTKFFLGRFVTSQGKKLNSESLIASGKDASFDAIITASTLVAAILNLLFKINIEGFIGAVISVFILKSGIEILQDNLNYIIGNRIESELTDSVIDTINSFPEVNGTYDMALHRYGPQHIIGSCHIEVSDKLSAKEIHYLSQKITYTIYEDYGIIITVGIYASNDSNPQSAIIKNDFYDKAKQYPEVLQVHGFYYDDVNKFVTVDLVLDFKTGHREKIKEDLIMYLQDTYDVVANINIDSDYSI